MYGKMEAPFVAIVASAVRSVEVISGSSLSFTLAVDRRTALAAAWD